MSTTSSIPHSNRSFGLFMALVLILSLTGASPALGMKLQDATALDAAPWTPPTPSYRIEVTADGLYTLDYAYLSAAGLPVSTLDPRTFRMFYMGSEIAIRVVGEDDGVFAPGDAVLFYGRGVDSLFLEGLAPTNKYTGTSIFWLTYGGANGLRMATRDGSVAGTSATAFEHHERLGRNYFYFSTYPFVEDADHWYDNWLRTASTASRTWSFTAANVATTGAATLTVDLLGYREGAHHIKLYVNNNLVLDGSPTWTNLVPYQAQASVPKAYLVNGSNVVKVELTYDAPKTSDEVYVNWVDIRYQDTHVAENNVLAFNNLVAGDWRYDVSNFATSDVEVYDVTDLKDVRLFNGATVSGAGPYTVGFGDSTTGTRRYLALTPAARLAPLATAIKPVSYPTSTYARADLAAPGYGAQYIILTHSAFWNEAGTLALWRDRDFDVAMVDVQQVYDQFNGGQTSAEAIHDFLAYAYTHWSPQPTYVVLLGDGSYDIRNYRYSVTTYIPPYLHLADPTMGETAADNRFVTITGNDLVPEMHLGRLPANTPAEAAAMISKITAYEDWRKCTCAAWNLNNLFISDDLEGGGGDFYAYSDTIADGYADAPANTIKFIPTPPYVTTKAYLGQTCDVSGNPDPATGCRSFIHDTLEGQGALLVSYVGHSTKAKWAIEALMDESLLSTINRTGQNAACLPVALPMTCYEGSYHDPTATALGEGAVRMPAQGFIASWSPTGFGLASGHDWLERGVVLALLVNGVERLGPATTYGKQYLVDNNEPGAYEDLLDTFVLIGDPGLRVKTQQVCSQIPTAVRVASFAATRSVRGVKVSWQTEDELDALGFRVMRRAPGESDFSPIGPDLIVAQNAGSSRGAAYEYLDLEARQAGVYQYALEILKVNGTSELYGDAQVTIPRSRLRLIPKPTQ